MTQHHDPLSRQAVPGRRTARLSRGAVLLVLAASSVIGSACAPLVLGGAVVGGALMASDRRTAGTQVEDQSIELKASSRIRQAVGDRGHINVTSYNRMVLITGEAASDADKSAIEQAVRAVENVRSVVNELAVMGASSMTSRSNDTLVSTRIKAAYVDAKDVQANVIKVVTERGIVHLMGRVTEREAARATEVARAVNGVLKVVRVFDIISEAELAAMTSSGMPAAPAPAPR
ncbi:MAG: BON domain-containing protein [Rubrivivax sp.]|jgi:osmotically-inducible protein OsmY|nr:BON domain-containing protein [Rubrivivax sp.]